MGLPRVPVKLEKDRLLHDRGGHVIHLLGERVSTGNRYSSIALVHIVIRMISPFRQRKNARRTPNIGPHSSDSFAPNRLFPKAFYLPR